MKSVIEYLKHPSLIKEGFFNAKMNSKHSKSLSDKEYISILFEHKMGRPINLERPTSFNEKLQWLKLNDIHDEFTDLSDKIKVKDIISNLLGKEYIVPTLKIYDSPNEIDFNELPEKFVLKCNHDSGSVIICRNKNAINKKKIIKKLNKFLKTDFYLNSREYPYKNIERKVFAEQYIETSGTKGIVDYKFYCFNGTPKFLYVSQGLENHKTASISFYDLKGKKMPFKRADFAELDSFKMPDNFDYLISLAEKLAKYTKAKFVRVDLYTVNDNVYFSEFTFFPCGGFMPFNPPEQDEEIGKLLII